MFFVACLLIVDIVSTVKALKIFSTSDESADRHKKRFLLCLTLTCCCTISDNLHPTYSSHETSFSVTINNTRKPTSIQVIQPTTSIQYTYLHKNISQIYIQIPFSQIKTSCKAKTFPSERSAVRMSFDGEERDLDPDSFFVFFFFDGSTECNGTHDPVSEFLGDDVFVGVSVDLP